MRKQLILGIALSLVSVAAMAASFDSLDEDGNGMISKDEFYSLVSDAGVYSGLDTDGDGLIEPNEFDKAGIDATFDYWDENYDGYIDSGEFYDSIFEYYDYNEDGYWDASEYDDFGEAGLVDV